jgi:hypothetical protein
MYCCDECNMRKGDRCPPPDARAQGIRFFRPDGDHWQEHFKRSVYRLESISNTRSYSIDALDLNRKALRALRELRERLTRCEDHIAQGIGALRHFSIDRLPPSIRAKALKHISAAIALHDDLVEAIEIVLREYAKSPLLDVESGSELKSERRNVKPDSKRQKPFIREFGERQGAEKGEAMIRVWRGFMQI